MTKPTIILDMDDCDANCEKWQERGGAAYLVKQSYSPDGFTFQEILENILKGGEKN